MAPPGKLSGLSQRHLECSRPKTPGVLGQRPGVLSMPQRP